MVRVILQLLTTLKSAHKFDYSINKKLDIGQNMKRRFIIDKLSKETIYLDPVYLKILNQ